MDNNILNIIKIIPVYLNLNINDKCVQSSMFNKDGLVVCEFKEYKLFLRVFTENRSLVVIRKNDDIFRRLIVYTITSGNDKLLFFIDYDSKVAVLIGFNTKCFVFDNDDIKDKKENKSIDRSMITRIIDILNTLIVFNKHNGIQPKFNFPNFFDIYLFLLNKQNKIDNAYKTILQIKTREQLIEYINNVQRCNQLHVKVVFFVGFTFNDTLNTLNHAVNLIITKNSVYLVDSSLALYKNWYDSQLNLLSIKLFGESKQIIVENGKFDVLLQYFSVQKNGTCKLWAIFFNKQLNKYLNSFGGISTKNKIDYINEHFTEIILYASRDLSNLIDLNDIGKPKENIIIYDNCEKEPKDRDGYSKFCLLSKVDGVNDKKIWVFINQNDNDSRVVNLKVLINLMKYITKIQEKSQRAQRNGCGVI